MTSPGLAYKCRRGVVWHLHETRTKQGAPRMFAARTVREGALAVMPEGFEFTESLTGVVSDDRATYQTTRVRHSGSGWQPFLGGRGPLPTLTAKFLPLLGTERFDESW